MFRYRYTESVVVFEDVCVLSATGTAAVLKEPKPVWKVARSQDGSEAGLKGDDTQEDTPPTTPSVTPRMSVILMDDDDASLMNIKPLSHKQRKVISLSFRFIIAHCYFVVK